jgi:nicotinamide-nucleotide amidase
MTDDSERVERVAALAIDQELGVATAESLTSGLVARELGAGPDAADWFYGGIIAYQESVKFDVLGVEEGPVVTAACAEQMAVGARRLLGAGVVVANTGVGGPDESEGKAPGTVFIAVAGRSGATVRELSLDGDPDQVLAGTVSACLALLEEVLSSD